MDNRVENNMKIGKNDEDPLKIRFEGKGTMNNHHLIICDYHGFPMILHIDI